MNRKIIAFLFLILIIFLVGCTKQESTTDVKTGLEEDLSTLNETDTSLDDLNDLDSDLKDIQELDI